MNYKCYKCNQLLYDYKLMVKHLKIVHSIVESVVPLKCIVNTELCNKTFSTFRSLQQHVKLCFNENKIEVRLKYFCLRFHFLIFIIFLVILYSLKQNHCQRYMILIASRTMYLQWKSD